MPAYETLERCSVDAQSQQITVPPRTVPNRLVHFTSLHAWHWMDDVWRSMAAQLAQYAASHGAHLMVARLLQLRHETAMILEKFHAAHL